MEWRVITRGSPGKGIQQLVIMPAEGQQEPTYEEWRAIRAVVETAVKFGGRK
jgi:hypothetical protein